jgi:hypothetical protein
VLCKLATVYNSRALLFLISVMTDADNSLIGDTHILRLLVAFQNNDNISDTILYYIILYIIASDSSGCGSIV